MENPTNLSEVLQYLAKQQQEKVAGAITDAQVKLLTVSYDRAAAYTTVIIFGGYAGIFGVWQLAREHLSKEQALWSALLVLISLVAYVMFEVLKMVVVSGTIFKKIRVLNAPGVQGNPQKLIAALTELEQAQQAGLGAFFYIWAVTVAVALSGALGGAGVLVYAFICGLAGEA